MVILDIDELIYEANRGVGIYRVKLAKSSITPGVEVRVRIDLVASSR
jgi:hypothetical protein